MASYSSGIQVDIGEIVAEESTAVDWSSKTPRKDKVARINPYDGQTGIKKLISINGSGYVFYWGWNSRADYSGDDVELKVEVDGSPEFTIPNNVKNTNFSKEMTDFSFDTNWYEDWQGILRFESNFSVIVDRNVGYSASNGGNNHVIVNYVLD